MASDNAILAGELRNTATDSLKVPPHSIEAEQAVLGGLLLDSLGQGEEAAQIFSALHARHPENEDILDAEGFFDTGDVATIDPNGYIVTNNHVADGADKIVVTLPDGRKLDATLVGHDPKTDLALIMIKDAGNLNIPGLARQIADIATQASLDIEILFVDDEVLVLQGLQRMLRPLRHEWDMEFVESGAAALDRMAQAAFDVANAGGAGHAFNRGVETIQPAIGFRHQRLVIESGGHACVSWLWR